MLGLGFGEIILILVVTLLVLGPEKLPGLARQAGTGLREFRRFAAEFQRNMNEIEMETKRVLDNPPEEPRQNGNDHSEKQSSPLSEENSEANLPESKTIPRTPSNSTDAP